MNTQPNDFDVLIIGAGHAGCEAALAAARMGCKTAVATLDFDRIGHLPCNCSIGGPAKGHLAREIDALGGEMGLNADKSLTHIRYVGTGKGPAVQTLRAHAQKIAEAEYASVPGRARAGRCVGFGKRHAFHTAVTLQGGGPASLEARRRIKARQPLRNG